MAGAAAVVATPPVATGLGAGSFVAPVITCIVAFAVVIGLVVMFVMWLVRRFGRGTTGSNGF
ncbi:hypothetical protein, partial [Acetobacter okinawensis]|uniref:hypothetical protein n=1 Tax=Acetobacter okinawensis TaxID=1076594 RepID=UPI001BAD03EE